MVNWLRVLGTAELAQIDQRVCQQLHPIVPLLDAFKSEQQALELILALSQITENRKVETRKSLIF
jgi:hypothetical protein